jgi:protein-disulfide isomerase
MKRKLSLAVTAVIALIIFGAGALLYTQTRQKSVESAAAQQSENLDRPNSPKLGPDNARVTIVEFLDPACETCRAFYPGVKDILRKNPNDVRLVIRYAALHPGSENIVRILEAARRQDKFWPVLEALLEAQPRWASHSSPNLGVAWNTAVAAGLNAQQAQKDILLPELDSLLQQEFRDRTALGVEKTPTFFVNGKPLPSFGYEQLVNLVNRELSARR